MLSRWIELVTVDVLKRWLSVKLSYDCQNTTQTGERSYRGGLSRIDNPTGSHAYAGIDAASQMATGSGETSPMRSILELSCFSWSRNDTFVWAELGFPRTFPTR